MRSLHGRELLCAFDAFEKDTSGMLFRGGLLRGTVNAVIGEMKHEAVVTNELHLRIGKLKECEK
jgi:hypothetical protein